MNWRLARSELEAERRYLRLDGEPVILYSLLSPPSGAQANLLNDLYRLDATMTVALEWRPWSMDAARRKIRGAQRHYFSKRYSMMAHMQETEGTSAAMVDSAAEAESSRLGQCTGRAGDGWNRLRRPGAHHLATRRAGADRTAGRRYPPNLCGPRRQGDPGRLRPAPRVVLPDAGAAEEAAGPIRLCIGGRGGLHGSAIRTAEGQLPGASHLQRDALAILETQWKTPYYYDLFHNEVGHTLVLGATGAGKSFTLNFLLVQALQYDPRVLILDLGGSYRWLTRFLGGGYLELSPDDDSGEGGFRLRPFALPAGERTFQFLTGWITRLLRIGGWQVSGEDPSEIRARIEDLYAFGRNAAPWGCWSRACPRRCGPRWGAGTAKARGEDTSTTRQVRKTLNSPTGR